MQHRMHAKLYDVIYIHTVECSSNAFNREAARSETSYQLPRSKLMMMMIINDDDDDDDDDDDNDDDDDSCVVSSLTGKLL